MEKTSPAVTGDFWPELIEPREDDIELDGVSDLESLDISNEEAEAIWSVYRNELFTNPMNVHGEIAKPDFMRDSKGDYLFTPGLIHCVYGLPGSRKSYLVQTAVLNHYGVYIDVETSLIGAKRRLSRMGYPLNNSNRFAFPHSEDSFKEITKTVLRFSPTIVAIDSFGRLCSLLGKDPMNDQDVGAIFNEVLSPLAKEGHAVVFIDHLPKKASNKDFPFGSQNKKAQSDVLILVEEITDDCSSLQIMKDRHYVYGDMGIPISSEFANLMLSADPVRAVVERYEDASNVLAVLAQKQLKERQDRIIKVVKALTPISKTDMKRRVGGNADITAKAINLLVERGSITVAKSKTPSGGVADYLYITDMPWSYSEGGHLKDLSL